MMNLPLFPLQTVLFPGMPLDLHIFEPRYRTMTRACLDENLAFGVVLIRTGMEALGPPAIPYSVGCTARILEAERLEDGCMNITVVGEDRFRILGLDDSQAYLVGQVETKPIENPRPLDVLRGALRLRQQVKIYLSYLSRFSDDHIDLTEMELPTDAHSLLYLAASLLQLPTHEKQPLLEAETFSILTSHLLRLYRREIAMMKPMLQADHEEKARRSTWLN